MNAQESLNSGFIKLDASSGAKVDKTKIGYQAANIGAKTLIGAGVGVVTGIFAAIALVQVLEIAVPAMLITKAAGLVGGSTGLLKGLSDTGKIRR